MQHRLYVGPDGIIGRWGSARIRPADSVVVHLLTRREADAAARTKGSAPPDGSRHVPLTAQGLAHVLAHPEDAVLLHRVATDFRAWLDLWTFQPEGGAPMLLGPNLWSAQERYVGAFEASTWVYVLKGRQLGATELEAAFDGWRLRCGPVASRVHVISLRETESREIVEQVRFGLDRVPEWLRLPTGRETASVVTYVAGPDDVRRLHAYPASRTASRSATCTHLHLDELAAMETDAGRVLQSAEPTVVPQGTFHILTTAIAPEDDASTYYRACERGEGGHAAVFVSSLERPDRDEAWIEAKRRSMPRVDREYPTTAEQALSSGGDLFFEPEDLDEATVDSLGLQPYQRGRRYLVSVDVGRARDATVILTLDVTPDGMLDVVHGQRLVGVPFPQQQALIERVAKDYKAPVVIEANGPGVALAENLSLPADRVHQFSTTGRSKPVALEKTWLALREQCLKWPTELEFLTAEMRGYTVPDTYVRQDAVMSLAIGVASADDPKIIRTGGRVLPVISL